MKDDEEREYWETQQQDNKIDEEYEKEQERIYKKISKDAWNKIEKDSNHQNCCVCNHTGTEDITINGTNKKVCYSCYIKITKDD